MIRTLIVLGFLSLCLPLKGQKSYYGLEKQADFISTFDRGIQLY